jgi:hypothetical protein
MKRVWRCNLASQPQPPRQAVRHHPLCLDPRGHLAPSSLSTPQILNHASLIDRRQSRRRHGRAPHRRQENSRCFLSQLVSRISNCPIVETNKIPLRSSFLPFFFLQTSLRVPSSTLPSPATMPPKPSPRKPSPHYNPPSSPHLASTHPHHRSCAAATQHRHLSC